MKEKDSKFTQYLLDCGIRSGWHDKEIDEFTNDPRALETVMQYVDNVGETVSVCTCGERTVRESPIC